MTDAIVPTGRWIRLGLVAAVLTAGIAGLLFLTADRERLFLLSEECRWSYECPGKGGMIVNFEVETCAEGEDCSTTVLDREHAFLGVVRPEVDCSRPSQCQTGAVPHALKNQGWDVGRWKVIAPNLKGLTPPEPQIVELEQSELTPVTLTYSRSS